MPSQRHTLELFTALRLLQPSWAGTLLLGIGLDETGRALALASLAAGAAGLFLDADTANLRAAAREGCTTFAVTTLDEALRTLKNELRQGHAITVALSGNTTAWLNEIVERGVHPRYLALCHSTAQAAIGTIESRGTQRLCGYGLHTAPSAINLQQLATAASEGWRITDDCAPTPAERRMQDAVMLTASTGGDPMATITRRWLRTIPALFPHALTRATWTRASTPHTLDETDPKLAPGRSDLPESRGVRPREGHG